MVDGERCEISKTEGNMQVSKGTLVNALLFEGPLFNLLHTFSMEMSGLEILPLSSHSLGNSCLFPFKSPSSFICQV